MLYLGALKKEGLRVQRSRIDIHVKIKMHINIAKKKRSFVWKKNIYSRISRKRTVFDICKKKKNWMLSRESTFRAVNLFLEHTWIVKSNKCMWIFFSSFFFFSPFFILVYTIYLSPFPFFAIFFFIFVSLIRETLTISRFLSRSLACLSWGL